MSVDFEYHEGVVHLVPAITLSALVCECCDHEAGHALTIGWAFWSLHIFFGVKEHPEDKR